LKNSKRLAIIGSHGMVGSDLVRYLKPHFQAIVEIDRESYEEHRNQKFDVVINANGNSNKVWANDNVLGDFEASTISVYKTLLDFPCKTYMYISSSDVYEDHTSEKFTSEKEPINFEKLAPYGFHKFLSECIVRNFIKSYIILRCPMMLGVNLKKGPVYDILNDSHLFISKESAFQMITTKELAQIIYFLIDRNITREIFNVGGIGTVLFKELNQYIKKQINFPKDGKTQTYETDVSKLNKIYSLKTSSEYLKSFLKNHIMPIS
jgi:dTDP-4-dehydrorhamnose reductase